MAKKKATKRAKKYEPKLKLKESVQWDDLINLSLQKPEKKEALKKTTKKK